MGDLEHFLHLPPERRPWGPRVISYLIIKIGHMAITVRDHDMIPRFSEQLNLLEMNHANEMILKWLLNLSVQQP